MESTLEQLLSIQGATEQQTIDSLTGSSSNAPGGRESGAVSGPPGTEKKNSGRETPSPSPENAAERLLQTRENASSSPPPAGKASPAMLEAWRTAYRVFTKYAPILRRSATLEDENAAALEAFSQAMEEIKPVYAIGGDAEILAIHIYSMLEDVYKSARNGPGSLYNGL